MDSFFTIIYIKTNRLSDERIAVGLLSNDNGLPEFRFSEHKLNFALKQFKPEMTRSIKRSLHLLAKDVNQYVNGETTIPMFDQPYAKKVLEKLVLKKRGLLYFSELFEILKPIEFKTLYEKYVFSDWKRSTEQKGKAGLVSFKSRFNQYVGHRRFQSFELKKWIKDDEFPLLSVPVQVDLFRQKNGFTIFKAIDFQLTENTVQQHIATYRMLIESLSAYSNMKGLSKGRYYLVYENPKSQRKQQFVQKVKANYKLFELIKMSEMADKI
ncbi:MAG: hypothetical protein AB8B72_11400 [Crocinitomicaceae bacterium]